METEQYFLDDQGLPWGAALVPEWWTELTPHHVMDFDEIERQRQMELGRLNYMRSETPDNSDDEGLLIADTAAGPYSLPGFRTSDGITDASFMGPGDQQWFITEDGFFYSIEDPDVRYTPSQMVESGHLPPGMEDYFVKGWDRARTLTTPVDGAMYARSAEAAWEKPQWLKKKLRSTDHGIALRHGARDVEERARSRSPGPRLSRNSNREHLEAASSVPPIVESSAKSPSRKPTPQESPSKSPVPAWQLKRQQVLQEKDDELTPPPELGKMSGESNAAAAVAATAAAVTVPAWKKKQQDEKQVTDTSSSVNSSSSRRGRSATKDDRGRDTETDWKMKQQAMSKSRSSSPDWKKKKEEPKDAEVPEWKKKQQAMARSRSSSPSPHPIRAGKKKEEPVKKKTEETRDVSPAPEWKKKQQAMARSRSNSPSPPMRATKKEDESIESRSVPGKQEGTAASTISSTPSWQKRTEQQEDTSSSTPSWKKPQPREDVSKSPVPAWKKKQQVANDGDNDAAPAAVSAKPEVKKTDPKFEEEANKLVSQGLVLKLVALKDDASRAKELRNTIAPTAENNNKVMVKPNELLLAIAHHAQIWKGQVESRDKISTLRQVAIIARLVIMKLYGADSSELIQFQEGLRPAFA